MAKIYILDDDEATGNLLKEFTQMLGYETRCYTKATDFLNENANFGAGTLLLLDLNMPEMDGIEVMRQLAIRTTSPPSLILMSGYDSSVLHSAEHLAQAHSLNIVSSLTKPISLSMLGAALEKFKVTTDAKPAGLPKSPSPQIEVEELKQAIGTEQIVLHYQPQIAIDSGKLLGVEALVRWQHPNLGLVYPNIFLPLAEQHDLMADLTTHIIRHAIDQCSQWKTAGLSVRTSVNISANNITTLTLPEQLTEMLQADKIDPSQLILEVTETALMTELTKSLDILTRLRMKGIELSIDDFGTGYSSLSQLHRIPFTELKVDQSFVMKMVEDSEAKAIVKTCILLGHELDMRVVAEGVETKEALDMLRLMKCDIAQGYYIAKPMPGDALLNWERNCG